MRRRELRGDLLVAAVLVILLLVLSPGTAFVGALALLVLLGFGAHLAWHARRRRRRPARRPERGSSERSVRPAASRMLNQC